MSGNNGRDGFPTINKKSTGINLNKFMVQRGLSVKDVQQYLNLGSVQSVYHWLNGVCLPSVDNLYALSQLFQVPVDDMLRGNRQLLPDNMNQKSKRLYTYYTRLNELCVA